MISKINIEEKNTWENKTFLTLDIDWADDDILIDSIKLLEKTKVEATWFVTHYTPLLERIRSNEKFELGIHPNFNYLLEGSAKAGDSCEKILDKILEVVPEAKSVRSHSMVQSTRLLELFSSRGLVYDCNHFIPVQSNIELKPWQLWNGLTRIPYFWEDDIACLYENKIKIEELFLKKGLRVFDFHPIHIFLNTENLKRYELTREFHRNAQILLKYKYEGNGTRTFFLQLLSKLNES